MWNAKLAGEVVARAERKSSRLSPSVRAASLNCSSWVQLFDLEALGKTYFGEPAVGVDLEDGLELRLAQAGHGHLLPRADDLALVRLPKPLQLCVAREDLLEHGPHGPVDERRDTVRWDGAGSGGGGGGVADELQRSGQ